jgi:hypothetical protein
MNNVVLLGLGLALSAPSSLLAQTTASGQPSSSQIHACSLLSKEEVKEHLPWPDFLDQMPAEEESLGPRGTACNYPSVYIQLLRFSQGLIDSVRALEGTEAVDGIGDEAYFHNNKDRYAEVLVKVGESMFTLQANADRGIEVVKPEALKLASAIVEKLP